MIIGNHDAPDFIVDYFRKITNLCSDVTDYFAGFSCVKTAAYFLKMKNAFAMQVKKNFSMRI